MSRLDRALGTVGALAIILGSAAICGFLGTRVILPALAVLLLGGSAVQGLMLRRPMRRRTPRSPSVAPAAVSTPRETAAVYHAVFAPGRATIPTTRKEPAHV